MAKKTTQDEEAKKVSSLQEAVKYFLACDALSTIECDCTDDDEYVYNKIPDYICKILNYTGEDNTNKVREETNAYIVSVSGNVERMKPDRRFSACCEAVENMELIDSIEKDFDDEVLTYRDCLMTAVVIAMFQNDEKLFLDRAKRIRKVDGAEEKIISFIRNCYFDEAWFRSRRPAIKKAVLDYMAYSVMWEGVFHPVLSDLFLAGVDFSEDIPVSRGFEALVRFWNGDVEKARELCEKPWEGTPSFDDETDRLTALTCILFFMGDEEALTQAKILYALYRRHKHMRLPLNTGCTIGLVCVLAFLVYGDANDLSEMRASAERTIKTHIGGEAFCSKAISGMYAVLALDALRKGDERAAKNKLEEGKTAAKYDENLLSRLIYWGACARLDYFVSRNYFATLLLGTSFGIMSYPLLHRAFIDILEKVVPEEEKKEWQRDDSVPADFINCTQIVKEIEPWMMRFLAIEELARNEETVTKRMVYVLNPKTDILDPHMQQLGARGWSKPRVVGLKRFADRGSGLDFLTVTDNRVASHIHRPRSWYDSYVLWLSSCCQDLEGHTQLYVYKDFDARTDELVPVKLQKGTLELVLKEGKKNTLDIVLPEMLQEYSQDRRTYYQYKDGVLTYYKLSDREMRLIQLVSTGLTLPRTELPRVLSLTRAEFTIPVRADNLKAEEADPVSTPVVQMEQTPAGFAAYVGVRPFGKPGTMFFPIAQGAEEALASVPLDDAADGKAGSSGKHKKTAGLSKTVRVRRDFAAEQAAFDALKASCPVFASNLEETHWASGDPEELLNLLEELKNCGVPNIVEWPKGRKISLAGSIDISKVRVKIMRAVRKDWFDVTGDVQLDEGRMLSLKELMATLKGSRFVALGDGEYVALTDDLRRRLSKLKLVSAEGKKDNIQVNALAAGTVEQALEDMELVADKPWQHSLERMHKAFAANPQVPVMLRADLREYQREGYEWMQRLAIWGVGGCLADDMGLGKTVQSIAVMLNQAVNGPCLVVAPTSVCANWELEIGRFAPSLSVHRLGLTDRQKVIDSLDANDVLIVGYGLLANVEQELCSRTWSMIVFDEAQAMKNAQTKRAKAAHKLEGDFRLALTGTPIENRIDDLWSLFNIINPGLLGSWESFSKRYGTAAPGTSSSRSLRAVVRPFLLRRLKSVVLDELPEKTEQNIIVEPNEKEIAFYETLRSNAVAKLAEARKEGGSNRIAILAELTRLRRACCHPGLADPDMMALEKRSSKTEHFLELVESLIASGHKVLAFSQFTTYLALIREALDEKHVRWLYLDGSTPEKERRASVAAFQKGEADVFLLSLKAGGTGLNLTAADYVIHLDPWWNPAVEDQASDRAHRIGQKRPVTIYRMIQRGSVEEKILQLHGTKRELASDFLEGTESAVKSLTEEDLMNLMR